MEKKDSSSDNQKKSRHGANVQQSLKELLEGLRAKKYLKEKPETINESDSPTKTIHTLYCPYFITLNNGERYALYTSSSMRTDRLKETFWDSFLMKKYKGADKCYLIYSDDGSKESEQFKKKAKMVQRYAEGRQDIDDLDGIISQEELYDLVAKAYSEFQPFGTRIAQNGLDFEFRVVDVLKNKNNIKCWNRVDLASGYQYDLFKTVVGKFCPEGKKISTIEATNQISKLPGGGTPKTDIIVKIAYVDNSVGTYTISCKRTTKKNVSVHQYAADEFIEVLGIKEEKLKQDLLEFQRVGGVRALGPEKEQEMTTLLAPYVKALSRWAIGGINGRGDKDTQWAQYLLSYNDEINEAHIYTIDEYIQKLKQSEKGMFGTPFQWTYASGSKGKNIQLKMPVV